MKSAFLIMVRRGGLCVRLAAAGILLAGLAASAARGAEPAKWVEPIRIGLASSVTRDTPEAAVQVLLEPFADLMESLTGITGQVVLGGDVHTLTQRLKANQFQLCIFQGVEFAWAQQECPELKPLMIAVNKRRHVQACVVVRSDSKATTWEDLRHKSVALPRHSLEHCHLFLQRCCREHGQDADHFFAQIVTPPGVELALDDVVRGKVRAAVVDVVGLEAYQREKPGCYERLKRIKVSELFPAAVVVYYSDRLSDAMLGRFKDGMARAKETAVGRQLMAAVRWTGFEPVPADYQKTLTEILKAYPPPPPAERTVGRQGTAHAH
ncbi:MAG TPA: PhnD/SsuA/transferrin family substrate-binding protein [Gemmataceae bacterium]|jgi:ABC-type phosphate/phosphonate transport system substrate-binding protein|nr:PhnD/SsuA/transferrin family substrate-binding protein [Gemmataceae bacterium]